MPQPSSLTAKTRSPGRCRGWRCRQPHRKLAGRTDCDRPAGDGVAGVDAEIGQDLVELGGVHLDRGQVGAWLPVKLDALADQAPEHLEHALDRGVDVEHLGHDRLLAGKRQQLAGQVGRTLGGLADLLQVDCDRVAILELVKGQFGVADDHAQHVVEVVGHAAGQPAD